MDAMKAAANWRSIVALVLTLGRGVPVAAQSHHSDACEKHCTVVVRGIPNGYSVRWPSLAVENGGVIVAANLFPVEDSGGEIPEPLLLVRESGMGLGVPRGRHAFAYPHLVTRPGGIIDLFWGDFNDSTIRARNWMEVVTSIWHSEYRRGLWSVPERVASGRSLSWGPSPSAIAVARDGQVHIVLAGTLTGGATHLIRIVGNTGAWKTTMTPDVVTSAGIIQTVHNRLLLAYVASPTHAGDSTAVVVQRSSNGGRYWSPPIEVAEFGHLRPLAPFLVATDSIVYITWALGGSDMAIQQLLTAASVNDGRTWGTPVEVPLPPSTREYAAVVAGCDSLTAAFQTFDGHRLSVVIMRIGPGGRGEQSLLLPSTAMTFAPALARAGAAIVGTATLVRQSDARPTTVVWRQAQCAPVSPKLPLSGRRGSRPLPK